MKNKPTLLLLIFFAAIIIICYSGYSFYNYVLQSEKNEAYTNISHTTRLKISQIINWKNERISDASFIQHNQSINRQILNYLNKPENKTLRQDIIDWLKELKENHEYADIIIIDKDYKPYSLFEEQYQLTAIDSILLKDTFEEEKIKFGIFYKEPNTGKIYTGIYIPLSLNNVIFGYMKIKIDPKQNLYPLIETVPIESRTAETFIVRRDGDSVTYLHDLKFRKNTALSFKLPLSLKHLPAAMAIRGTTGIVEGIDYSGTNVLADLHKIEGTDWFIVSKISMDEVYTPVRSQGLYILLGVTALIAILGLIINNLWKNQKVEYLNSQLGLESELKKSREQFKSVVETAMDGVITIDANQNIVLFNKASEKIFGVTADQAVGMPIEKFIPVRFHESHRKNIEQFAKDSAGTRYMGSEGIISGRRADGEEMIMEASISHFKIEGNSYYTVIHRDITARKKMEEAFYQSELRFRSLVTATSDVLYLMSPDWSEMLHLRSGGFLESTEKPEKNWLQKYIHPEDREYVLAVINESIRNKKIFELEHRVKMTDGSWGWTFSRAIPIINQSGELVEWFGAAADVTKRKRAEEELLRSEEKFSKVFKNSPLAMAIADAVHFATIDVNPAFEELFGYKKEEVIGKTSADLQLYNNMDQREYILSMIKTNGIVKNVEITINRKNGEQKDIVLNIEQTEIGGKLCLLAVSQDITERKKTEQALKEIQERFSAAFSSNPNALVISRTDDGKIVDVNETFLRLFKYSREEVIGNTSTELGMFDNPEDRNKAVSLLKSAGSLNDFELEVRTKNGEKRSAVLSAVILNTSQGRAFLTIIQDITEKTLALEALRQSEQRFQDLAESMPQVVWTARADGSVDYYSKAVNELEGITLTGEGIWEWAPVVHEDDIHKTVSAWQNAVNTGTNYEVIHRIKKKDGGFKWFLSRAVPVKNERGEILRWYGTSTDISFQKEAEEKTKLSENRFRDLIETQQEMIIRINTAGQFTFVNNAFCRKFGVIKEEFTGSSFIPLVHPDDRPLAFEKISAMEHPPYQASIELREYTKEGLRWIEWHGTAIRDSEGRVIEFQAVGRDIHERRIAEDALIQSEARLREAQTLAHLGNWELDLIKNELTWSDEVYRIFGLEPQEFGATYEAFLEAVHPDDRESVNEAYTGSLREGKDGYEIEHRIVRKKTGEVRTVHEKCNHFRDDKGTIIRSVGMVHDITELKKAEEKLKERERQLSTLTEDLTRSNKDLEQFAYAASHDLQEPIRMISSYAQLISMRKEGKQENQNSEFLGFIIEGASRMHQLVDDLLQYSRISTAKQEFENVDCNKLLREILSDLRFRIEDENALIIIDELPVVKGNSTQLRQLFQNFLTNSLKFRSEKRPEIKISCERKDSRWLFSVKDNGIGIEEQYYDRIFIIFQRLHNREKYPGSGIGLAVCKKIVERHGGQVCVESQPGKGTVFYFTLKV